MVTTSRVDEYANRIENVKAILEQDGWVGVRNDEWRKGEQSLRFSYAHNEFRLHVKANGRTMEQHSIHVRDEPHSIPSVAQILLDILQLDVTIRNDK